MTTAASQTAMQQQLAGILHSIGEPASSNTLAILAKASPRAVARSLWSLVQSGEVKIAHTSWCKKKGYRIAYYIWAGENNRTKPKKLAEEPPGEISIKPTPHGRIVRFGKKWKATPAQTCRADRAGMQSGMAMI